MKKYPCSECGRENCDYKNLICKKCCELTIRTLRIPEHKTVASGAGSFQQYLDPGETIHKAWFDMDTREHVLVIRKHVQ